MVLGRLYSRGQPTPESSGKGLLFQPNALETLVETGELAAAVDQPLLAARPGRMGLRIDLKVQRVAGFAIGRARLVARTIRHHNGDLVVVRVDAVLHRALRKSGGFIAEPSRGRNSACGVAGCGLARINVQFRSTFARMSHIKICATIKSRG